jgi:hypothetical protein
MEDRFNVIRKAWDLVEPSPYNRDPKWLRIAASRAAKAGRLPRHFAGEPVLSLLFNAGYGRAIDHPAIERVDGAYDESSLNHTSLAAAWTPLVV